MKKFLSAIPATVWIILAILLVLLIYWKSADISAWYEHRKQAAFDAKDAQYQTKIDDLHKQVEEALALKRAAEAREQIKAQEADTLRQLIDARGGKIEEAAKKIEDARKQFETDSGVIEQAKKGEISLYDLCTKQCNDSKDIGYPCRVNYCDTYKK